MAGFDAIVLAGGSAARLGGADKPGLDVGGRTLLARAVDAVAEAGRVIVVGPPRELTRPVIWRREDPPGGGPLAGLAAGLAEVGAELVLVLAADLPWIAPAIPELLDALRSGDHDATVLVDAGGRANPLAAAWRTAALRRALAPHGDGAGVPVRALLAGIRVGRVHDPRGWGQDCDTWDEVHEARERAERSRT